MSRAPVIVIAGPTASGKSDLAVRVAEEFGGVVINADSMQVYRDLRVLTARPDPSDEARVPHRLYGYRAPDEPASAADWSGDAHRAIEQAYDDDRRPIVIGGTGLYLKTLMHGIAPVPPVPDEVRQRARARRERVGAEAFFEELSGKDPEIAARLHAGDSQRVLRAWEVHEATGRALSAWHRETVTPSPYMFQVIVLEPPRAELYASIDNRFDKMLSAGALEEVRALSDKAEREGLDAALPIFKALGYPALRAYLHGEISHADAAAQSTQQTRNYAKRQQTWLRTQLDTDNAENPVLKLNYSEYEKIFSFIS